MEVRNDGGRDQDSGSGGRLAYRFDRTVLGYSAVSGHECESSMPAQGDPCGPQFIGLAPDVPGASTENA